MQLQDISVDIITYQSRKQVAMNKKWGQAFRLAVYTSCMAGGGKADPSPFFHRTDFSQTHFQTTTAYTDLLQIALATENRN